MFYKVTASVKDKMEYSEKLASLVEDGSNSKMKKDLTLKQKKLRQIQNKNDDDFTLNKYRHTVDSTLHQVVTHVWSR